MLTGKASVIFEISEEIKCFEALDKVFPMQVKGQKVDLFDVTTN